MARARWIHNPVADLSPALCWVPFAVGAHQAHRSYIDATRVYVERDY